MNTNKMTFQNLKQLKMEREWGNVIENEHSVQITGLIHSFQFTTRQGEILNLEGLSIPKNSKNKLILNRIIRDFKKYVELWQQLLENEYEIDLLTNVNYINDLKAYRIDFLETPLQYIPILAPGKMMYKMYRILINLKMNIIKYWKQNENTL